VDLRASVVLPLLLLAALPLPAAAGTWHDEESGVAVDLGADWDVTTSPKEKPGERLGRPMATFRRGDATAWLFVYGNAPVDPAKEAKEAARLAAHLLASRYDPAGEVLVPGLTRPADLGAVPGLLLEFEVGPRGKETRTRAGRAAMAVHGGRLHFLVAERPASGAAAADLAGMERLVLSLRPGVRAAGTKGEFAPVAGVPSTVGGDGLPPAEFRSAVEMRRVAILPSGLQVFRQYYLFEGARLPSYLTHLLGKEYVREGKRQKTPDLLLLLLNNAAGKEAATVRVEIQLLEFGDPAARTVTVAAGETAAVSLSPVFSAKLYELSEQRPGAVRLRLSPATGKPFHEETEKIVLLGRNDFFWRDGNGRSWAPALAAFVTPHDAARRVDGLLRAAKDHSALGAMVGYQDVAGKSRIDVVRAQMGAVYDALGKSGFSYVNAPFSADLRAQRIKYPTEALEDRAGNCIEAVLVFAAAFEALGMQPVILVYADHAQVAVKAWGDDSALVVLETTLCGRGSFGDALRAGEERFRQAEAAKALPELVDIRAWRETGIAPVPR
jgi:hypothetical protein